MPLPITPPPPLSFQASGKFSPISLPGFETAPEGMLSCVVIPSIRVLRAFCRGAAFLAQAPAACQACAGPVGFIRSPFSKEVCRGNR